MTDPVDLSAIRSYWEREPLATRAVPHEPGTPAFYDHYDRLREENESTAFSAWLHEYAALAGRRVLDVGCGNGYVLERYARAGAAAAVGVDLTRHGVELSATRLRLRAPTAPTLFLQSDAQRLPFPDASFDAVCSMGVLHHIPDPARGLSEIRRVLRPGGRLILMLYHRNSFHYRLLMPLLATLSRRHRGKSLQKLVNQVDGEENPLGRVYSRRELAALLDGFAALEFTVGQFKASDVPWVGRFLPRLLYRWAERRIGWFLYVKATRQTPSP